MVWSLLTSTADYGTDVTLDLNQYNGTFFTFPFFITPVLIDVCPVSTSHIFDFDSADNGIWLPDNAGDIPNGSAYHGGADIPYHRGSHGQYNNAVLEAANDAIIDYLDDNNIVGSWQDLNDAQMRELVEIIRDEANDLLYDTTLRNSNGRLQ